MASARDIRRRIKGVKGTGKITRAMEMISAVKMRKAVASVQAIRPYAETVIAVLRQLALAGEDHPLLETRAVKRALYVVVSSNRGLCGAFNTQIIKRLRQTLEEDAALEAVFITLGKKAESAVRRIGRGDIIASFNEVLPFPSALQMRPWWCTLISNRCFPRR